MGLLDVPGISRRQADARYGSLLGEKLRRLAAKAVVSNPLINPPWVLPPAWAALTAYSRGNVVSNGGNWFVCATAGTSASSGGPSNTTTGDAVADGTVAWCYIGGATLTASDPTAPTVTVTTSSVSATYPNQYLPTAFPGVFRVNGGYPVAHRTTLWEVKTFNSIGSTAVSRGASVSCIIDDDKFAIFIPSNALAVRVIIDGRYYSLSGTVVEGSDTFMTFDFSATSGRRRRLVTIEGNKSVTYFGSIRVTTRGQVFAPPALDATRAVMISDSMGAGSNYGPWLAGASCAQRLSKLLGIDDVWNISTGSRGYIDTAGGAAYTFGQNIAEALTRSPEMWVFMGSTNDCDETAANVKSAAKAAYQAIRSGGSTSPIVVFGLWPINNAAVGATEQAVHDAVTEFDDPLGRTFFIPIYADPSLPWVTGAWNNSANTQSANAVLYIAGDNTHPSDLGTAYMADRMAAAIREQVLPYL